MDTAKKVSSGFTQTCQMRTLQGYTLQRACVSVDKKPKKLPCSQYTVLILTVPKLRFCSAINSSTWQLFVATLKQMDRSTLTSVFSLSRRDTRAWTTPSLTLQIHKQYIYRIFFFIALLGLWWEKQELLMTGI